LATCPPASSLAGEVRRVAGRRKHCSLPRSELRSTIGVPIEPGRQKIIGAV